MIFQLLLILVLSIFVGLLLFKLERLLRELNSLKSRQKKQEEELTLRSEKIIADANATAMRVIQEAHVRAEKVQTLLDEKLNAVNDQELEEYKETIQNISKDIENQAVREIKDMQQALKTESLEVQEIVGKKVDEALVNTLAEINTYKEKKIAEINNRMVGFIKELSIKAIGVTIDPAQQTEFVLQSLKEAKESHVF